VIRVAKMTTLVSRTSVVIYFGKGSKEIKFVALSKSSTFFYISDYYHSIAWLSFFVFG